MSAFKPTSFPARSGRAILGILALVATLMVSAGPASAATTCDLNEGTGEIIIHLDEGSAGAKTTLAIDSNFLRVNGVPCGTGSTISIVDDASVAWNHVEIDLTGSPLRMDGEFVFTSLFLSPDATTGALDKVTILGTNARDFVQLGPNNLFFDGDTPFPSGNTRLLAMQLSEVGSTDFQVELDLRLNGGADTFDMFDDGDGFYPGPVGVRGGSGADVLTGGPGAQTIRGGADADVLRGGSGNDKIFGNSGDDQILGGTGDDRLRGGGGDDSIWGKSGADHIKGGGGADNIRGGGGADHIKGGGGADNIRGGGGADTLLGNKGTDTIRGGGGNDAIWGGKSADSVWGKSGSDSFNMVDGSSDVVRGGKGNDVCTCDNVDVGSSVTKL